MNYDYSVGWRKSALEVFGKTEGFSFTPPCIYDAVELAKPFEER